MIALGRLALIAADRGDWLGCTAKIEAAFDVVRTNGLEEYWICSSAHIARGRLFRHDRRPTEARAELERAVSLARRGAGLVELSYALTTLAELRRELGDRRAARELVLEARELLSRCPEPGTLAPRLVERLASLAATRGRSLRREASRHRRADSAGAVGAWASPYRPLGQGNRRRAGHLPRHGQDAHQAHLPEAGCVKQTQRRRARPRPGTALAAPRPSPRGDCGRGDDSSPQPATSSWPAASPDTRERRHSHVRKARDIRILQPTPRAVRRGDRGRDRRRVRRRRVEPSEPVRRR